MSGFADILKSVAPAIATALGGPLAGAAVSFLASKFGVDPVVVEQTVAGMGPAELVKMKGLDLEFRLEMAKIGISLDLAQIATNTEEAKSTNWWVAGWRPGVGWVCVAILALSYIPKALTLTTFWAYQAYLTFANPGVHLPALPPFPDLGITDILGILGTLLGSAYIAKLRTDEKVKGAEARR